MQLIALTIVIIPNLAWWAKEGWSLTRHSGTPPPFPIQGTLLSCLLFFFFFHPPQHLSIREPPATFPINTHPELTPKVAALSESTVLRGSSVFSEKNTFTILFPFFGFFFYFFSHNVHASITNEVMPVVQRSSKMPMSSSYLCPHHTHCSWVWSPSSLTGPWHQPSYLVTLSIL